MPNFTSSRPKILMVTTTFPRWPGDKEPPFIYLLSLELSKDYDIYIMAPHSPNAETYEIMNGLKIYRYKYFFPSRGQRLCYDGGILPNLKRNKWLILQMPFLMLFELINILKISRKHKIDLIHAHWIPNSFMAVLAKIFVKIPLITTIHGGDVFGIKGRLYEKIVKSTIKNSAYFTVISKATRDKVKNLIDEKKLVTISMGVDTMKFDSNKKDLAVREKLAGSSRMILFVGRLVEKKGVEYLIRAIPRVIEAIPDTKVVIAGDGPEKSILAELAIGLGIDSHFVFVGLIDQKSLPAFYASADLFVCPSIVAQDGDTEGLGVVILEAMASGITVVASNVGGIPDIVIDGVTGYLAKEKDPDDLANKIIMALNNQRENVKLAENARNMVCETYSWERVANRFAELYNNVLGNRQP